MKRVIFLLTVTLVVSCSKFNKWEGSSEQENQTLVHPKKIVENYKETRYDDRLKKSIEVAVMKEVEYEIINGKVIKGMSSTYENKVRTKMLQIDFTYENDLLKTIIATNLESNEIDDEIRFEYESGKMVKKNYMMQEYGEKNFVKRRYKYEGSRLIEIQDKRENGSIIATYTYEYQSDTEIYQRQLIPYIDLDEYGEPQEVTRSEPTFFTLDAQKRVVKSVTIDEESRTIREYQYDDKNNYKNHFTYFATEPDHFLKADMMKNNPISQKVTLIHKFNESNNGGETVTYNYQYNDKGYPTRIEEIWKVEEQPPTIKITEITY